jgi:hypothetical protein
MLLMQLLARHPWLPAFAMVLAALALLISLPRAERATSSEMGILVPAYFYPRENSPWDDLIEAAARVPITAILNPSSGPGNSADENFAAAVDSLRAAGGRVVGYVHTDYGLRPMEEVTAEVDRYAEWYAIDGIFVDEMSNSGASAVLRYYGDLYAYMKAIDAAWEVIGNPGTNTHQSHIQRPTAARFVVTENTGEAYASFAPSAWNFDYDALHFAHLVHTEPSAATMTEYVSLARSRNAGLVYITDDTLPNPWNTLPNYWAAEVDAVAAINAMVLAGDYNSSGRVEQADLDLVLLHWGQPAAPPPPNWTGPPPAGTIDQDELDAVLLGWGDGTDPATSGATGVPEPMSIVLAIVALAAAVQRFERNVDRKAVRDPSARLLVERSQRSW